MVNIEIKKREEKELALSSQANKLLNEEGITSFPNRKRTRNKYSSEFKKEIIGIISKFDSFNSGCNFIRNYLNGCE
jgi:hypothetical protein